MLPQIAIRVAVLRLIIRSTLSGTIVVIYLAALVNVHAMCCAVPLSVTEFIATDELGQLPLEIVMMTLDRVVIMMIPQCILSCEHHRRCTRPATRLWFGYGIGIGNNLLVTVQPFHVMLGRSNDQQIDKNTFVQWRRIRGAHRLHRLIRPIILEDDSCVHELTWKVRNRALGIQQVLSALATQRNEAFVVGIARLTDLDVECPLWNHSNLVVNAGRLRIHHPFEQLVASH